MKIARTVEQLRAALGNARLAGAQIAFVPTMGNLHAGHASLVRRGCEMADRCVASIFVNQLQFLPSEDFHAYPRTLDDDCAKLEAAGCDLLFAPDAAALHPQPQTFRVFPDPALADILEGMFRPGFFTGVCTIVMKLLNCVQPQYMLLGKKDYQQLRVVREMVGQYAMPVNVVEGETCRDTDGLALSSRNGYLSLAEREEAIQLSRALRIMAERYLQGHVELRQLEAQATYLLDERGWQTDYMTIRRRADLRSPVNDGGTDKDRGAGSLVALGASRLGRTRLIDAIEF